MLRALTIAIPSYRREQVLIETIVSLLALQPKAEIIVADQTDSHEAGVAARLDSWAQSGEIRRIVLLEPSIPAAMNAALREARSELILFLDDDIVPDDELISAHLAAHSVGCTLVAGRVIQPWDNSESEPVRSTEGAASFMGGNFSVDRKAAIAIGGFDENFVRVAYNFEREFAHRWLAAGHRIVHEPRAVVRHLKAGSGGTRSFGEHLTTVRPDHAVGAYYHLLRTWEGRRSLRSFVARPVRAVATRHHLRRPWWIPVTLSAEVAGMAWALQLAAGGPQYIGNGRGQHS
jgi:glycosyltransferase involved in cell wall biosynthesis